MLDEIARFARGRLDQSVDLLARLVDIPSGVRSLDGMRRAGAVVSSEWQSLGFAVEETETPGGPVWVAKRPASTPDGRVVLFLTHVDTVYETAEPTFAQADGRATGPGVADMKGGIVVSLDVVRTLDHVGIGGQFTFLVVMNSDEESSSPHSRSVIEQVAEQADLVLVFEPARPNGAIVKARRGLRRYRLTVQGRAAHAGVEPEKGASAIEALARKIVSLQELNRAMPDLSVNVGTMHGGSNPNVVADRAVAEVDVRMASLATAAWVHDAILEIARRTDVNGTESQVHMYAERPPMAESAKVSDLVEMYARVGEQLSVAFSATATGGGSDGNFTAALGKATIDGLGPVGGGYHSDREFVLIDSIAERASLTAGFLAALATERSPVSERDAASA